LFCVDESFNEILEEQYYLSKLANIGLEQSGELPDFERRLYTAFMIRDRKEELDQLENN